MAEKSDRLKFHIAHMTRYEYDAPLLGECFMEARLRPLTVPGEQTLKGQPGPNLSGFSIVICQAPRHAMAGCRASRGTFRP